MRFLQASDFHLRPDAPHRLDALREVVRQANAEEAGVLLIPGDLFDSPEAAEVLRVEVRDILETFDGKTVVIPGNHDLTAFAPEADYGRSTIVLAGLPYSEQIIRDATGDEVRVFGVPYQDRATLGQALAGLKIDDPLRAVLLAHGTFEGSRTFALAELEGEEDAYFPICESDLKGRFAYAALGHLHTRVTFDRWSADAAWGYAGSPVAVTRGELGPRHAVLVDVEPGVGVRDVRPVRLNTDYWESLIVQAAPWESADAVLDRLRLELAAASSEVDPRRGLRLKVDGWTDDDEAEFRSRVEAELDQVREAHREVGLDVTVRTIALILSERPELVDLLARVRRLGEERQADEETLRTAVGLLVEAAGGGGS